MTFYIIDKNEKELDLIRDILCSEGIRYSIERHYEEGFMPFIVGEVYDIACYTDYEHFEYVKYLFQKYKKRYKRLERCYTKKVQKMFDNYIKKIIPIPIVNIEVSKDGYSYRITTYSSVIDERGVAKMVEGRIIKNKRIKKFYGWFIKPHEPFYKQTVITFQKVGNP